MRTARRAASWSGVLNTSSILSSGPPPAPTTTAVDVARGEIPLRFIARTASTRRTIHSGHMAVRPRPSGCFDMIGFGMTPCSTHRLSVR